MKKFYIDCTDAYANSHNCQVAIPEDKIQSYIEHNYSDEKVVKFDSKDINSDAYCQALDNENNVVLGEWYDSDRIIKSFANVIRHYERGNFDDLLIGVSSVKYWEDYGEPVAVIYASDLDEEYIKAISEKVGHRVVRSDFHCGLFTKQMFDKWRSEIETMYNEIF